MHAANKRVAILVDTNFEQAEFTGPLEALKTAGVQVTVVSTAHNPLQGLHHIEKGDRFTADQSLEAADPTEFDALVLPGGAINADALRVQEKARDWVRDFLHEGKLVAAICHAPWLLASANVLEGRKLTSYFTIQDDLRNAGGEWIDEPVVIDDNLITSRQPDDIPAFNEAILAFLEKEAA